LVPGKSTAEPGMGAAVTAPGMAAVVVPLIDISYSVSRIQ
jgi:hypothetical protein